MKAAGLCAQLAIKESYLMKVFVNTINGLLIDRDKAIDTVGTAVKEALAETGGALFKSDELQRLDDEIDSLQAAQIELSKKRSRRELDADAYNNESRIIMARMDGLFAARDNLAEKQSEANLSVAYQEIVEAFMENAQEQDKFDKDVFARASFKISFNRVGKRELSLGSVLVITVMARESYGYGVVIV